MADIPKYGREMREKEFSHLRKSSTFLNHGSYGVVPTRIKRIHQSYIDQMDEHPDDWFRRHCFTKWKEARDAAAEFVKCDPDDLVFVQNATSGVNTVLNSVPFKKTETILSSDFTYPACKKACRHAAARNGTEIQVLNMKLPIHSEEEIIQAYENYLSSHPEIRLAIIDHITSSTALLLPIKKIIQVCRKHNVFSLIDGAHAPGQVALDLRDIDADFYTGNLHKWCFTPRGCAILYVKKEHQTWLRPLVTSHFHLKSMTEEFFMQGTRDDSSYVTVPHSLKFYEEIGGIEAVTRYNSELLEKVVDILTSAWGTQKVVVPKSMEAPCMRLIKLPDIPGYILNPDEARRMMDVIYKRSDIQVAVTCFDGSFYFRPSAQIYNIEEDYRNLIEVIKDMATVL